MTLPDFPPRPWLASYDAQVPHSLAPYPELRVEDFLRHSAERFPTRTALVEAATGRSLSYSDWDRQSDALAAALLHSGLQPGDVVALYAPNGFFFAVAFFGILKMGGTVTAVNPLYAPPEVAQQLTDSAAACCLVDGALQSNWERARTLLSQDSQLRGLINEPSSPPRDPDQSLTDLLLREIRAPLPVLRADVHTPAILQYTGGTTGIPKGAIGTHGNLVANTRQFEAWVHDRVEHEVILDALPLFHVYGLVLALIRAAYQGATLVFSGRRPDELIRAIRTYRPTFFPGVPALYYSLLTDPHIEEVAADLGSVRTCISGAAPLPPELAERFAALTGARLREGYGLSEAPTATHCNPLRANRPGSIGLPLPDVEALVVDAQDGTTPVPIGQVGELIVRSPTVMAGYYRAPEATAQALRHGWLYTGDLVRMDAEGYFYLVDRKVDVINTAGFKVYPSEVEAVLRQHPAIAEVAVAGVPDARRGEAVHAWVVLKPNAELEVSALRTWAEAYLARYKLPHQVHVVESLPRSAVQKLLRRTLRKQVTAAKEE